MKKVQKPLNKELGSRIRERRKASGYTQERFAEAIDCSVQHISNMERGLAGPSLSTLITICTVLNVTSDYLLMGTCFTKPDIQ